MHTATTLIHTLSLHDALPISNTAGTAFLGLTMECARCHDHKFDPISQKDYFSVFAFFNNIDEAGQISWDNATPVPTMLLTRSEEHTSELQSRENIVCRLLLEK